QWACVDINYPGATIILDSDAMAWEELIDKAVKEVNTTDEKQFLIDTICFISDNKDILGQFITYKCKEKLVCRHLATIALTFYSKLLAHESIDLKGYIRQISADEINKVWKRKNGHVW